MAVLVLNFVFPVAYRELDFATKVQMIANLYIHRCTVGDTSGNSFYKLRSLFRQKDQHELHTLYDYLFDLAPGTVLSVTEVYANAYAKVQREKINKIVVEPYKEYSLADL